MASAAAALQYLSARCTVGGRVWKSVYTGSWRLVLAVAFSLIQSECIPHPALHPACRAVDEGTNPDSFTVQLFRDSLAQNQARCDGGPLWPRTWLRVLPCSVRWLAAAVAAGALPPLPSLGTPPLLCWCQQSVQPTHPPLPHAARAKWRPSGRCESSWRSSWRPHSLRR